MTRDDARRQAVGDQTLSKAGFLGGLLALLALIALSVTGLGHARTIAGAANPQYWIVVAVVAAALVVTIVALARTPARTAGGDVVRKAAVALAMIWLAIFLWESIAVGTGAFSGPFELGRGWWKG